MYRHLLICCSLLTLAGCAGSGGRDNGMIVTHDGRVVSETAEVARDELAYVLTGRATEAAGAGYHAVITITVLPELDAVRADEFGWKDLPIQLQLVPPRGATGIPDAQQRAEAIVLSTVALRVPRRSAAHLTTTVTETGAPLPGSQTYVTVAGDTLAGISTAFYGAPKHWRAIADANPGIDQTLPVGTSLVIPPNDSLR